MSRIAVLGDIDSIKCFTCLGLDTYPCNEYDEVKKEFKKLVRGDYSIIYVTEKVADLLRKEISETEEYLYPIVIPIPGISGNNGLGLKRLKEAVERAVGSDMIFS